MPSFAIVGLGKMGKNYLKVLGDDVKYIVEPNVLDSDKIVFRSIEEFIRFSPETDLVIVASPANTHYRMAKTLLTNDFHVLVEKPLCLDVEEAKELCELARSKKLICFQSCPERFNPVIRFFKNHLRAIRHVRTTRTSVFPCREYVEDKYFDLLIHDLDLVRFLGYHKYWEFYVGYEDKARREMNILTTDYVEYRCDLKNGKLERRDRSGVLCLDISKIGDVHPLLEMVSYVLCYRECSTESWWEEIKEIHRLIREREGVTQ